MHTHDLSRWTHNHDYLTEQHHGERNTLIVIGLTAVMMVVEIISGTLFGSIALLADGWHMGTHVAALVITAFAYRYARKHAQDSSYTFGTGKVGVLGGFASAVGLGVIAFLIAGESLYRFVEPRAIRFDEAIWVAVIGLVVNLLSAYLLKDDHHHHHHGHSHGDHGHAHDHDHHHAHGDHGHTDHNLRAAYLHVLADALTSVLAIVALTAGKFFGWTWMDALMGVVGSLVIARWSYGLLRDTSGILLDRLPEGCRLEELRQEIEEDSDDRLADLHVWRLSSGHLAGIATVVSDEPQSSTAYKEKLSRHVHFDHLTVEINQCPHAA